MAIAVSATYRAMLYRNTCPISSLAVSSGSFDASPSLAWTPMYVFGVSRRRRGWSGCWPAERHSPG